MRVAFYGVGGGGFGDCGLKNGRGIWARKWGGEYWSSSCGFLGAVDACTCGWTRWDDGGEVVLKVSLLALRLGPGSTLGGLYSLSVRYWTQEGGAFFTWGGRFVVSGYHRNVFTPLEQRLAGSATGGIAAEELFTRSGAEAGRVFHLPDRLSDIRMML